ncbi:unnamed protein product [Cladocopium goreaui]|uniref:PDZ domain-containing protein n=1 Tax=Cladocopium goreaui TaxID=2562237 RepID=A0A9P1FRR6_9DINO|nr:unnamed protein product [Cladocopium goreaui]
MVALRNARVRCYVLLCHFFCFWHFAARALQFSALPPNTKMLKDVEHNEVPSWIREQMCDLEYDEDIANKVVDALSGYRRKGLMEVSEENLRKALANEFSASADCIAIAQSLYNRIQKGIAEPQPVQSDVPENVKAFARALYDAKLKGQILRTETGSFKLQNVSEIWDEKQFYVRDCYTEIADIMLKN